MAGKYGNPANKTYCRYEKSITSLSLSQVPSLAGMCCEYLVNKPINRLVLIFVVVGVAIVVFFSVPCSL